MAAATTSLPPVGDVDMRLQASDEQKTAAKVHSSDKESDSQRLGGLRAALRANLELGCSVIELQTAIDAIAGAETSEAECRVTLPSAKRRIASGTADMETEDEL